MSTKTTACLIAAFAVMITLNLLGCSGVKKFWKATKTICYESIEPWSTISLDASNLGDIEERRLAHLFKPVDERIYALCKFLDGEDQLPKQEWFRALFDRFPWINGVMVVDTCGEVQFQHPADFSKPIDIKSLLAMGIQRSVDVEPGSMADKGMYTNFIVSQKITQLEATNTVSKLSDINQTAEDIATNKPITNRSWADHTMRAMGDSSAIGSEIYLAQPFFKESKWLGLIVVHFDPRNLMEFCPEPDELIMLSSDQILWTAKYQHEADVFIHQSLKGLLKKQVTGSWSHGGRNFYWLSRQLGGYHLVYAVNIEAYVKNDGKLDKASVIAPESVSSFSATDDTRP
ncbi:conserved hypothetical protein [Desulfovibrionales bacterium]